MSAMPVEQMIGLPRDAMSRMSGRCHSSYVATLNALTPSPSSRSTASWSNGVDRKSSPRSVAWSHRASRATRAAARAGAKSSDIVWPGRQDAVEVLRPCRRLGHDRVGPERLELDRVGAGLGGDVDEPAGLVEVAVVVRAGLRDDVDGRAGTDRPIADPHDVHRASSAGCASATASAPRPAFSSSELGLVLDDRLQLARG